METDGDVSCSLASVMRRRMDWSLVSVIESRDRGELADRLKSIGDFTRFSLRSIKCSGSCASAAGSWDRASRSSPPVADSCFAPEPAGYVPPRFPPPNRRRQSTGLSARPSLRWRGQIGHIDLLARGQNGGPLDHVAKFANIARPRIAFHRRACRFGKTLDRSSGSTRKIAGAGFRRWTRMSPGRSRKGRK